MYPCKENEKGSALLLVLFLIMTFTVLGVGVMISTYTSSSISKNFEQVTQAKHLSDIGLYIGLREFINSGFLKTTHTEDMNSILTGNERLTTDVENCTIDEEGNYLWEWDEEKDYNPLVDFATQLHGFMYRVYYTSDKVFIIESDGWYGSIHQRNSARGRVESMFEFSYLSAGDLGDFVNGSDYEIRGKVHANGNIYLRPSNSTLNINPLYFNAVGNIIRSRDAWNRPDDTGYGEIQIIQKNQDSEDWVEMEPGDPRGEEGSAFDSYHPDWNSKAEGVMAKWGGIVRDSVPRKYLPPFQNLDPDGYYDRLAQEGGLVIDNTSHYESWCVNITDFYNDNEQRYQALWEIDVKEMIDQGDWPDNGLIYCKVPVRLVNANNLSGNLMLVSCRNVYTSGSFNTGSSVGEEGGIYDVTGGTLNINPSNSSGNEFIVITSSEEFDIDSMEDEGSDYTYTGSASEVNIMVKAQGRTLTINGEGYELSTNTRYKISGSLNVNLYNLKAGNNWNNAKGHRWINIRGNYISFDPALDIDEGDEEEGDGILRAAIMTSHRIYHLPGIIEEAPADNPEDAGLLDGHIDVDTSSSIAPIGSGSTDGHIHEYDDKYDVVGTDYFDLLGSKLHNITTDIPDVSTKFKLIIANADLSPGGRLVINQDYDPGDPGSYVQVDTYDDTDLASLPVYSFDGVSGTTKLEKLGLYFNINVIPNGNLIPTNTGDVKKNVPGKFGEWRNGALTIQAVQVNADGSDGFTTNTSLSNGGVHGVATSGLLWESTIFWHWKGPSYHESDWDPDDSYEDEEDEEMVSDVRINAALVDGAPAVDEYNWVDRDGDHRYDYNNNLIYDDWNEKYSGGFNNPYNSSNPNANTKNLLGNWSGNTLIIYGSIVHLGSNYNFMADNLDNSGISDYQIAWIRSDNNSSANLVNIYNPDLATPSGQPPFTPLIGQIINVGR